MEKERSTHGFGLAVFSLVLLGLALVGVLSGRKICVIASIISILSVVFAAAAYFEARRANGARKFALIAVIITIIGAYLVLAWSGTIKNLPFSTRDDSGEQVYPVDTHINDATDLIEKAEELEEDSIK